LSKYQRIRRTRKSVRRRDLYYQQTSPSQGRRKAMGEFLEEVENSWQRRDPKNGEGSLERTIREREVYERFRKEQLEKGMVWGLRYCQRNR